MVVIERLVFFITGMLLSHPGNNCNIVKTCINYGSDSSGYISVVLFVE